MASSEEGFRPPLSLWPSRSVMTKSSPVIMPLLSSVGDVRMRRESRRREILPSVAATYRYCEIQRPARQISRRCSSSVFSAPGDIESDCMHMPSASEIIYPSRVKPSELQGGGHSIDRYDVSGDPVVHVVSFGIPHHLIEAQLEHVLEAFVYLALAPEKALAILNPLEVADRDAARIPENVRDDENPFSLNDRIGLKRRRSIGAFAENPAFHPLGIPGRNLIFCRRGHQYFARMEENVLRIRLFAATGKLRQ